MATSPTRAARWATSMLVPQTAGEAAFPLFILSLLYFFDEFDTAAFATLAPDVQRAFHLTDNQFGILIVVNVSVTALLAVPFGYLADRAPRIPLVIACGLLAGVFSLLTGLAPTVAALTLFRLGNGIGLLANGTAHNSLLADYYTPARRPEAFAYHTNALYLGAIAGPVFAGVFGAAFGWRTAFYALIIPIVVTTSILATRLHEPARGATDDGPAPSMQSAGSFRSAVRTLVGVPTLKLQYIAAVPFGAGLIPLAIYLPLFYERTFHLAAGTRGILGGVAAAFTFAGVRFGGRLTPRWFAEDMGEPLRRAALALAAVGVGLSAFALAPWVWLAVAVSCADSYLIGLFFAPFYATQALVSPARVRTLSFSFGAIFLVIGVIAFYATGLGSVSDRYGIRWGIVVLTPFWLIGGAILHRCGRHVARDATAAINGA